MEKTKNNLDISFTFLLLCFIIIEIIYTKKGLSMVKRNTNIELLRVIASLIIPVYHWLLYNGIFYAQNSSNSILSLTLFSGIQIMSLYAFIATSSYFLIQKKYNWKANKLFSFITLVVLLYIFKTVVVNQLFPGYYMNEYVNSFFLKGSWWYVYPYLLLMAFYPLLNYIIYKLPIVVLYGITTILVIMFTIPGLMNTTNFFSNCIAFLSIYFTMGCLQRNDYSIMKHKHTRIILCIAIILGILIMTSFCLYFKLFANTLSVEEANACIQKVHCRYNIIGLIGGIFIFLIFKNTDVPYNATINHFAKYSLYIFLIHETVMSVFWYFYIKSAEFLAYLPAIQFWGYIIIYELFCIITAYLIDKIYSIVFKPLFDKLIIKLCETTFIKGLENHAIGRK